MPHNPTPALFDPDVFTYVCAASERMEEILIPNECRYSFTVEGRHHTFVWNLIVHPSPAMVDIAPEPADPSIPVDIPLDDLGNEILTGRIGPDVVTEPPIDRQAGGDGLPLDRATLTSEARSDFEAWLGSHRK